MLVLCLNDFTDLINVDDRESSQSLPPLFANLRFSLVLPRYDLLCSDLFAISLFIKVRLKDSFMLKLSHESRLATFLPHLNKFCVTLQAFQVNKRIQFVFQLSTCLPLPSLISILSLLAEDSISAVAHDFLNQRLCSVIQNMKQVL